MPLPDIPALENSVVRLEPLTPAHAAGLREAASGPRDGFGYTAVPTPDTVDAYLASGLARRAAGESVPFAQIDARTGKVVGHTTYLAPRFFPDGRLLAVEIGSTWLAAAAQGTAINTAAKLLLLIHAFEALGAVRVDIKTDARNERSRGGILAVGAKLEGILRSWQPSCAPGEEGKPRDTAMYSVIAAEWPETKLVLEARLAAKLRRRPA